MAVPDSDVQKPRGETTKRNKHGTLLFEPLSQLNNLHLPWTRLRVYEGVWLVARKELVPSVQPLFKNRVEGPRRNCGGVGHV